MRVRAGKTRRRKWLENALSVCAVRALRAIASALPHRAAMRFAGALGRLAFHALPGWRRTAVRQLGASFPEWAPAEVTRRARGVFISFAKTMFEFLRGRNVSDEQLRGLVRLHGIEHLRAGLEAGRGVILLSAHYDNWEWTGRRVALELGVRVSVIARSQDDERLTRVIDETRAASGLTVVDRDDLRGALRALRRGEALGIVPDQNVIVGGVFVEFFGRPASTALGPSRFAAKTGALVLHSLSYRREDDTHDAYLFPVELPERTGDAAADDLAFTQAWTRGLERWIREVPEQWLWFHKRWSTQPTDPPAAETPVAGEEGPAT